MVGEGWNVDGKGEHGKAYREPPSTFLSSGDHPQGYCRHCELGLVDQETPCVPAFPPAARHGTPPPELWRGRVQTV